MPAKKDTLNSKMQQAAMLLGQGYSVKEAAELVGKPEDTVLCWKRKPAFQAVCAEECNKWLSDLRPQALLYIKSLLEADDKRLGANAATTLAKAAGMTLTQYYAMFPEMQKTPTELINMALNAYDEKWGDRGGVFEFLFSVNQKDLTGKGVGAGTAVAKGAESGVLQYAQGVTGFVRNYITETDEATVQAWNRHHYGGPMGRAKAKKEFTKAIESITDPERKAYWQNYMAGVKDIYDLPFNFSDESVLNGLYENKKALKQIESFMLSNGTPAEYAAFMISSSLVDNTLSMAAATATTAITGNPFIGTMVGFGPATAYQASEAGRAAGLSQPARNMVGLVAAGITSLTEAIPLEKYMNTGAFMRGELNVMKAQVMNGGTSFAKKLTSKIIVGTSKLASRMIENSAVEMTQETFENILNDIWLNLAGVQNKSTGEILDDAGRAGVMAMITSPFLTGEAYLVTAHGKVKITNDMSTWTQQFVEKKTAEAMKNPATLTKVIDAQAAADTIETLTNGGLKDVDTSAIEKTKEDLKKAEANLSKVTKNHNDTRTRYADEMHKCTECFTAMSDEVHDLFLQTLINAKTTYQSANKIYDGLGEKLKSDQNLLDRLVSGLILKARADAKVNAQTAILSEVAAQRMDSSLQKPDEVTKATAQVELPLPENVSNDKSEENPLALMDRNSIMNEGTQVGTVVGVEDTVVSSELPIWSIKEIFGVTPELENHIKYIDSSVPRSRGIGGAHNSKEFFKNDIQVVMSIISQDIPGVTYYQYNMPRLGKDGLLAGGYGTRIFEKTVYDPNLFSDREYMRRGLEAANDSCKRNHILGSYWEGYDSLGIRWVGYGRDGRPISFFPDIPKY